MKLHRFLTSAVIAGALAAGGSAQASLTTFASFSGAGIGLSTGGWGSTTQSGTISANVPVGATVLAAYLYTSTFGWNAGVGGTFNANVVSYTQLGPVNWGGEAGRADVTSIVKPLIDGGVGGVYNFSITETQSTQDGSALVVVYSDPTVSAVQSVGILDGFSETTGDSTAINFTTPLDPTAPGFLADMRLGIGFSFDGTGCTGSGQSSSVTVNGTTITDSAGCSANSDTVFIFSVGIPEASRMELGLWPVPVADRLNLRGMDPSVMDTPYDILDASGRSILHGVVQRNSPVIDVHGLASGAYLLSLRGMPSFTALRFIKE